MVLSEIDLLLKIYFCNEISIDWFGLHSLNALNVHIFIMVKDMALGFSRKQDQNA